MVGATRPAKMDPDEFLAWERRQLERHVYVRGEVYAMAGGSPRHSQIAGRAIALLQAGLAHEPCDAHRPRIASFRRSHCRGPGNGPVGSGAHGASRDGAAIRRRRGHFSYKIAVS